MVTKETIRSYSLARFGFWLREKGRKNVIRCQLSECGQEFVICNPMRKFKDTKKLQCAVVGDCISPSLFVF